MPGPDTARGTLPSFEEPPVAEVVLSVGFDEIPELRVTDLGRFWTDALRDDFPDVEEHAPYQMPIERFPAGPALPPDLQLVPSPPLPRLWFRNEERSQLVQLQKDWFAFNWEDAGSGEPYPRFPAVRDRFLELLGRLRAFMKDEGWPDLQANQCEVTYINHVAPDTSNVHGDLAQVLALARTPEADFLPAPEQVVLSARYVIPGDDGEPVGRLHVDARPAFRRTDDAPIIYLNLTARGVPLGGGESGIVDFLELGHVWVVQGFVDVTTKPMQRRWKRRA